jgi:hypothetical protein
MFELVLTLVSFIFAIAMTHLLTSATELIQARHRVVFSGLQALWMTSALVALVINWVGIADFRLAHWTAGDVIFRFVFAIVQYFTCSLLTIRVPEHGTVDMGTFFQTQRSAIMAAFAAMFVVAMAGNYLYRQLYSAWLMQNALCLAGLPVIALAALARPVWLQWAAGLFILTMGLMFLIVWMPN